MPFHRALTGLRRLTSLMFQPRLPLLELLSPLWGYFSEHPHELVRIARAASEKKLGVPLALVRKLAERGGNGKLPTDLTIEAVPPGIRVSATVELMGAKVRASGIVFVESVMLDSEQATVALRFSEVALTLLNDSVSPLAALIRSGALDLTKLGNLLAVMPRRPPFLVEAKGDRVVIDLRRVPALSGDRARRVIELVTPVLTVTGVASGPDHVDIEFGVFNRGVGAALAAVRTNLEQLTTRWDRRSNGAQRKPL